MNYGQQFRDMAGSYAQCDCEGERLLGFGALRGEQYVRSFYGDALYDAIAKIQRETAEMERARRAFIARGDFIDDVACQLQPDS